MRTPDPTVVWLPFNPLTVAHLDQLASRIRDETAAIPHDTPLQKPAQLGEAMARAWEDNEYRIGVWPLALDKAA